VAKNLTMQLTYLEAIRQGIWEEMDRDPSVFCLGEDIGIYGGAFKVTDGFIDRFGPERVIDTPIAESAIVGAAFGASLTGMRPVAEFQFMDFIGCAFNQISNMVAKTHYLWGAPAPLVLRGPSGGYVHGGPFQVVAVDGVTLNDSARYQADTVNVGPGQRYDVIWTARKPGKWLVHCHIPHHTANDNVEQQGGGGLMLVLNVQ